nr:RNA-directed DNA polymerase [Caballeronia sp. Lep1P3]
MHTKVVAKANPNDYSLLGNLLDLAVRNGQDRQTIGIPIGPDTSLVIAEAILSSVDAQLAGTIVRRGFRYIDDIACGFHTIAQAEEALGRLQYLVGDLQLQLNPRKTRIIELPYELEASWVPHLRLFAFRSSTANAQQTDLLSYFGRAFELAAAHREEAILRYSVQRMRSISIFESNWALYESLLLQCLSVEPGTAPAVIGELYKYHLHMPLDRSRITESLQQLIEDHAPLHHGSEVVWALWGAICLGCPLDATVVERSLLASDPCAALCALHARAKGLVVGRVDVSALEALMHDGELTDAQWLLAYEANVKGWLPNIAGKDFVGAHKHFGSMKTAGVSFYDEAATHPITPKPAAVQGDVDADIDYDVEYMLGDVSG